MTEFLKTQHAQNIAAWSWWVLMTLSAIILVFTGIDQSWDNILLRISTGFGLLAGAIAKIMPKNLREQLGAMGENGGDNNDNEFGVKPDERIIS